MKASSLYFALGAAQVAICAPMARSLTRHVDDVSDTGHGVATPPLVWLTLDGQDDAKGLDQHDSATPHPIDGDIPPPPPRRRIPKTRNRETPDIDVARLPPVYDENDILERSESGATGTHQPGMPCLGVSDSERNNRIIVFLAMVFFVMVGIMEACGSIFQR